MKETSPSITIIENKDKSVQTIIIYIYVNEKHTTRESKIGMTSVSNQDPQNKVKIKYLRNLKRCICYCGRLLYPSR